MQFYTPQLRLIAQPQMLRTVKRHFRGFRSIRTSRLSSEYICIHLIPVPQNAGVETVETRAYGQHAGGP